jgi:L-lactate dehydrogenase complex protein LldE
MTTMPTQNTPKKVGLFVTCLADMFRPSVAFATVKLLEAAGYRVEVPEQQTCCGQPAYNSGDKSTTAEIARQTIEAFDGYEFVVGPSGSCIGMLHYYPDLFIQGDPWKNRAEALKARAYEITQFLTDIADFDQISAQFDRSITYHDSCSGLRQLKVKNQPRQLLSQVAGLRLNEMEEAETCCGFGGTFCVKYPEISNRMVSNKTGYISDSDAEVLVGGDLGCLLNMAGKLKREGKKVEARHVVEILANMTDTPAIGESEHDYNLAKAL